MKTKLIASFVFLSSLFFPLFGQVTNYALAVDKNGYANFGDVAEMNQLENYTIQFWFKANEWTPGGSLFTRGSGDGLFALKLGTNNQLVLHVGNQSVEIASPELMPEQWIQFSCVATDKGLTICLDNEKLLEKTGTSYIIPYSNSALLLGADGFSGSIDEFRIWNTPVTNAFERSWRNTVNKHHPKWDNLVVYYKFDQDQCEHIVDYKFLHHGRFEHQASRVAVNDNPKFRYRTNVAYSNFSRWADRQIDKDKYLLSNDLILLDFGPDATGKVERPFPYNEGVITNGGYLSEFKGRKGVLALNGEGANMNVGTKAFNPEGKYTFSTWVHLDEWTEGAYLFKKERSDNEGFSIRLGDEAKKRIIIRINGVEYTRINYMKVNEWIHLNVSAYSTTKNQVYQIAFDGQTYYATNNSQENNNYVVPDLSDVSAYVGLNLKGKLDETVITHDARSGGYGMDGCTIPGPDIMMEATQLHTVNSYWKYDQPENPGYDYYSYKHFVAEMRKNYEGHRGYRIRAGIHGFTGWESAFEEDSFRKNFAKEIAALALEFDGVDLDFEWCYSQYCWDNYGKVIEEIRKVFPKDRVFTVTPHYVSYSLRPEYVAKVDYFPFQIYGPSKDVFLWNTYLSAYDRFIAGGRYPKDKIVMSYATTTSRGYDPNTDAQTPDAPIGVRSGLLDNGYSPEMSVVIDGNGKRRYITGYNQTIERCEFVQDNDLKGIMYWDMGNDVKTSHPYSLVKAANYSIASNVDTLVQKVDFIPASLETGKADEQAMFYPNPARDVVTAQIPGDVVTRIELFNQSGQMVKRIEENNRMSVTGLPKGIYFAQIFSESNRRFTSKLIIR